MTLRAPNMASFPRGGTAVVIGASGSIGGAILGQLLHVGIFERLAAFSRAPINLPDGNSVTPGFIDVCEEESICEAAEAIAASRIPVRLLVNATGFLHGGGLMPEKTWRQLNPEHLRKAFAVNAIGAALLMKHFLPLLAKSGKAVYATLSARIGSIEDNRTGGWYSYRASKAALNQLVRTASVELARSKPEAICVALHPGTVESRLTYPFRKDGLVVRTPEEAALLLLEVLDHLKPKDSGLFLDYHGQRLSW